MVDDRESETAIFEHGDDTVGRRETVRTPAGQRHGVDLLDQVVRSQGIGFPRAGPAPSDVDAGCCAAGDGDDGRPGLPAGAVALMVAHTDARYVEDRAERSVHGDEVRCQPEVSP